MRELTREMNRREILAAFAVLPAYASFGFAAEGSKPHSANVHPRGSLSNSLLQFENKKRGHVAFMGGSITEMNGYRPMVCKMLEKRFPETKFSFTDAGIASTCSTTGAFRLASDVLSKGPVDLFFVEFAVNDDQDAAHSRRDCVRGMEGIIRHTRLHNPMADIVVTHFVNPSMLATIQSGKTPLTISAHEEVARRYDVPTVNLAKEVADRIAAGTLSWKEFGGTHPKPLGNAVCAAMVEDLLRYAWSKPQSNAAKPTAHAMPEALDAFSYAKGKFVDPKNAVFEKDWVLGVPNWKTLKGDKRERFLDLPMLCAEKVGAELTLNFQGNAIGAYILAGPDAGIAEASIDGGPIKAIDLYHRHSKGLHYPRTVMFAAALAPGKHKLRLRIAKDTKSAGHAMRIMRFAVNGDPE